MSDLPSVIMLRSYKFVGTWMPPVDGKRVIVYESERPISLGFLVAVDDSGVRELCVNSPKEPPAEVVSAVAEAILGKQAVRYRLAGRRENVWIYQPDLLS